MLCVCSSNLMACLKVISCAKLSSSYFLVQFINKNISNNQLPDICIVYLQQFLFHLSQVKPRRAHVYHKKAKQQATAAAVQTTAALQSATGRASEKPKVFNASELNELCAQSFNEAIINLKQSPTWMRLSSLSLDHLFTKKHPIVIRNNQKINSPLQSNPWAISYKSESSFRENRGEHADGSRFLGKHSFFEIM